MEDHGHHWNRILIYIYIFFKMEGYKVCNYNVYTHGSSSSVHPSSNGKYKCPRVFGKDGCREGFLSTTKL